MKKEKPQQKKLKNDFKTKTTHKNEWFLFCLNVKIESKMFKTLFFPLFVAMLISISVPLHAQEVITCNTSPEGKTDQQLQSIFDACEKEIADQKKILEQTQKESSALEKGIAEINYNINKTQLEIKAKNAKIKQLGETIVSKEEYIGELSERTDVIKVSISKIIRESNNLDGVSVFEIILSDKSLSDIFKDLDNYSVITKKLNELSEELLGIKKTSEEEKVSLEQKQTAEEKLKFEKEAEKRKSENYKAEKQRILETTKGQEDVYEKVIADKVKKQNQIRNRLFRTVGGEELTFGEALKLIQPYESMIGVDSAFVLAILTQESAINGTIGKNIGRCTYNQASPCGNGKTVMAESQKNAFINIIDSLGLNADEVPVSCPICRDGNYGGAMGPAQFMPNTWWDVGASTGYKSRVASVLNISTPSPFKSLDAFTGTALYLKDAQARCKTAFSKKTDIWACAASKYYGGLALSGSRLTNFMYYGYGSAVSKRAVQFQADIDTLNL